MSTGKSVTLTAEAQLDFKVQRKGMDYLLNGKSDYSMWYDDQGMSTNLVICEAKDISVISTGVPQCLAYMGKIRSYFSFPPF
jgi:hypothetical protein